MRSFLCMRRAQQCRARRQSAAVLPSHAPHDSKARLQLVTTRRDSWRSHVHRTYTPQAAQSFKPQTANVRGRGGRPLVLSLGGCKGGYSLSRKRVSPFYALPHGTGTILLHRCRKKALLRLRRKNALLCNQHRAAHIMLLDRHFGRHELLAADEHRRAVELRHAALCCPHREG